VGGLQMAAMGMGEGGDGLVDGRLLPAREDLGELWRQRALVAQPGLRNSTAALAHSSLSAKRYEHQHHTTPCMQVLAVYR
jgi:hypothetical protein